MANFSKAFNFRGGFQVDTDVLVVRGQNVGIGSTIPNERLVVDGTIKAEGLDISSRESVAISSASVGFLSATLIHSGVTSITNGIITATSPTGVVTYYGDGGRLLNLPTSQWLDVDVGLGFTSIYAQGNVGVDTVDPRFVFQVGGVPYPKDGSIGLQTGVGIETGNIWVSGDYTSRGNISAAGTITAGQFVGFGSGIQNLNASNLGVGSIPSNVYGDEIFTGTVYGDLVGTATTASSIASNADVSFDRATVREIEATQRVYSPLGRLQVGTDLGATIGDVDVRKTGNSTIYSISDNGSARIFAGSQREFGASTGFGGLRFGGNVLSDPLSGPNDLDVINYDVGNLNFYLHAGPAGVTSGRYQWIYGQSDRVLADLDRLGQFSLAGNLNTNVPTLRVSGITSTTGDVNVGGGLSVTANSMFKGNLDVEGDLTLSGSIGVTTDSLELPATTFEGRVVVGNEPFLAAGCGLGTDGTIEVNRMEVYNGATTSFTVNSSGTVDAQGIGCTGLTAEFEVRSPLVVGGDYIGNNGFINNSSGAFFNTLDATNLSSDSASITSLSVGSFNVSSLNIGALQIGGITLIEDPNNNLSISNPIVVPRIITSVLEPSQGTEVQISVATTTIPSPQGFLTFVVTENGGVPLIASIPLSP